MGNEIFRITCEFSNFWNILHRDNIKSRFENWYYCPLRLPKLILERVGGSDDGRKL